MKPNLILLFCTLAFFYVDGLAVAQQRQPAKKVAAKPVALRPAPYINIVAVGDIMMGTAYPNAVTLPPDSGRKSFKAIEKYLKNTDVAFGNLEGTLIDTGAPAHYKLHLKSKAYLFRSPVYYGGILKQAGFNLLSIANNHASDFGDAGRASTVKTLDHYGIHYAGSDDFPTTEFTVKGIRYGFCAFAPNAHTNSILDLKKAALFIRNLKQHCDIVIVSFHGGGEGGAFEHVRRKQCKFAVAPSLAQRCPLCHQDIPLGDQVCRRAYSKVTERFQSWKDHLMTPGNCVKQRRLGSGLPYFIIS